MSNPKPGYPLPEGEAFTEDLACMMVFYPDNERYRQAFFGAYFYFGNWLAWERDTDKRGKDAARAWKLAIEATLGCIEMNTCETILQLLTEIRDNTGIYCCDVIDISDGDQYTDAVEDGVGDVPQNIIDAGYAEDAEDWDGFDDYKCMISHLMIDNMVAQTQRFQAIIDEFGAAVVTVAAVAAIAAAILATGGAVLLFGIVLAISGAAGLYAALAEIGEAGLPDLLDAMEEHHDDLACAIYHADGSANAVIALKAEIDLLFNVVQATYLKNLNLPAQLKALYAGRYDQQDVAEILVDKGYELDDFDCECLDPLWYIHEGTFNPGFDEDSNPCEFDSLILSDRERIRVFINYNGSTFHGPMREIDEASIVPAGNVTRIVLYNQLAEVTYDSGVTACAVPVSVLVGKTCASIRVTRIQGDCANDWFDLRIGLA